MKVSSMNDSLDSLCPVHCVETFILISLFQCAKSIKILLIRGIDDYQTRNLKSDSQLVRKNTHSKNKEKTTQKIFNHQEYEKNQHFYSSGIAFSLLSDEPLECSDLSWAFFYLKNLWNPFCVFLPSKWKWDPMIQPIGLFFTLQK